MSQEIVQYAISDVEKMANAVAKSQLFGMKTPEQAMALMLVAQAEGIHPMTAAMDYHIINGKPTKTAQAMMKSFQAAGGKITWHERTDQRVSATFFHPAGGEVTVDWDMERAKKAGVLGNPTWTKYPRQMLSARVISEGVRATFPGATSGMYEDGEAEGFTEPPMKDVTPRAEDGDKGTIFADAPACKRFAEETIAAYGRCLTVEELNAAFQAEMSRLTAMKESGNQYYALKAKDVHTAYRDNLKRLQEVKPKQPDATNPLPDDEIPFD